MDDVNFQRGAFNFRRLDGASGRSSFSVVKHHKHRFRHQLITQRHCFSPAVPLSEEPIPECVGASSDLEVLQWHLVGGKELCIRSNFFCCLLQQVFVVTVTCTEVRNLRKENESQMGKKRCREVPCLSRIHGAF